jgi:hypothetical protein
MPERRWPWLVLLVPVVVLLVVAVVSMTSGGGSKGASLGTLSPDSVSPDIDIVIPAGTAARLRAGETLTIIPSPLDVKVGQVIRIRNEDIASQDLGPFRVGAGQTLVQRFNSAGTLEGVCAIHPSGRLVVNISA